MANIRTLFAQLRLNHFHGYLSATGWRRLPEEPDGRVRFELDDADDDQPFRLRLPPSDDSPRRGEMLQRAVHTLCEVEDRQPAEIANDLLAAAPAPQPAPTPHALSDAPRRLRFRNDTGGPLTLRVASRSSAVELLPHEAIELTCKTPDDGALEISLQGDHLVIQDHPTPNA